MDRVITQRYLRNHCDDVLREVQAGRTVVIARRGMPVAELRPITAAEFVPRVAIVKAARRGLTRIGSAPTWMPVLATFSIRVVLGGWRRAKPAAWPRCFG